MRIKGRLLLSFALVVCSCGAVGIVLTKGAAEAQFRSFVFSGDSEKAEVYAGILAEYYAERSSWEGLQDFLSEMPAFVFSRLDEKIKGDTGAVSAGAYSTIDALLSDRIAVADAEGRIIADTSGKLLGTIHPATHLSLGAAVAAGSARIGTVLVGSMIDATFTGTSERFIAQLERSLALAILASAALAILLGLALSLRITGPLAVLDEAARKISSGDLSVIVPVSGKDEVASLSASFNAMTGELRRLDEAKRRIIADSAHELRTPVTLIRGSLEAMLDGVYPIDAASVRGAYDETMRLSRLIDMLRELELIDSGELRLDPADIELGPALEKAAGIFGPRAGEKDIAIEVARPVPDAALRADPLRFDEVLYNLIDNAIKYSPRGGRISLSARLGTAGLSVAVDDSGPGIPEAERGKVFERFYRMDKSRAQDRGGRGLGLSIAYEIAKAHGGSIRIEGSPLGGSSFIATFPILPRG